MSFDTHFSTGNAMLIALLALVCANLFAPCVAKHTRHEPLSPESLPPNSRMKVSARQVGCDCVPPVLLTSSAPFGGGGGTEFSDERLITYDEVITSINVWAGRRVDGIEIVTNQGSYRHGGSGGTKTTFTLSDGETVDSMRVCRADFKGKGFRIFSVEFTLSNGRSQRFGADETDSCTTISSATGHDIIGLYGRAGNEIDQLGAIFRLSQC